VLKVLADVDGEALRGVEVRRRAKEDYGVTISSYRAMNGVRRSNSNFPNYMEDASYFKSTEGDADSSYSTHQLKPQYIDTVREQL
jgi:hypothetical protein